MKLTKKITTAVCALAIGLFLSVPFTTYAQFNLGNLLNTAGQALQNATATTKFSAEELVGTWKYSSPGVNFKGDDALAKVGGIAAATAVEQKLAPYYKKVGLDKFTLTVEQDLTFTMTIDKATLKGTIEKEKDGDLKFKFGAFNKINIGTISCIATKSGSMLNLTFDASKMLKLAETVTSVSSNSTFQSINNILKNYEGMYMGAKLKKESK